MTGDIGANFTRAHQQANYSSSTPAPPPAPRKPWHRTPLGFAALIGGGLLVLFATLAGINAVSGGGSMTVHGTEVVTLNPLDGTNVSQAFPDITAGTEVTVVSSSGTVIGSGSLSEADASSWTTWSAAYSFTVTVPSGEPRYGIQIGHDRGTVWFTQQQMAKGPGLSLSGV